MKSDIQKIIVFLEDYKSVLQEKDTSSSSYAVDTLDDLIQRLKRNEIIQNRI